VRREVIHRQHGELIERMYAAPIAPQPAAVDS
jgi:hypothetical protein